MMVVSIGRNVPADKGRPMSDDRWNDYVASVTRSVRSNTPAIHFVGFGTGTYEGAEEESFTLIASTPTVSAECAIRVSLSYFAKVYRQDSIACTIANEEFIPSA